MFQLDAQSPGGVSSGATNQMWLDANQLTLNNGDPVVSWTDMSVAGNDATIAFPVRQPTFNTAQVNGLPSVVFDGSDFLQTTGIAAMNVGTITQFVVFDGSPANHNGVMLAGRYTEHSQFVMNYRANGNIRTWVIQPPNTTNGNITAINSSYQVLSGVWDAGTGDVTSYKNGTSFGTNNGATTAPTGNAYYRIGANSAGASYFFNGGIAEAILYSSVLNSAEKNIVDNYLAAKYNLPVANDYYSFEATHGRDLVGVGQESDGSNTTAIGGGILQLSNPTTFVDGDYVMAGHDGAILTPANTVDVPVVGNVRFDRVWRVDIQGGTETVDITFDLSTVSLGAPAGYRLLVDADGVFATGATQTAGVYNVPAQTVTFSGISLTAGQYVTLMNNSTAIQSTGVTTDWHTTTTWDCGCIPVLGNQVTILAGHTVDINGTDAQAGALTIDATGILTFSGGDKLTLDGDFTNNGSVTAGLGEFDFTSTAAQTISGATSFYDITINNAAGVTVSSGPNGIQGLLDVTSGTITTGGFVTMLSNSSGSGAIKNPVAGIIVGDLTVQRYVNESNKWYLLASPLTDADLEDWNQEFEMQGFPGTEWFPATSSVYFYDETAIVSDWNDGFLMPTSTADIATNGLGWDAYIDDDGIATGPRSIDLTGTPQLGDGITLNGTNSNTLVDPDENGWNLFANPYAAPFTWGNVAKSNVIAGYRKGSTGAFVALNNGSTIATGEGFWVQVNVGGGSMTFDANDVTGTNADTYNQRQSSFTDGDVTYFNLKLIFDSGSEDLIEVGFAPNATNNLDMGKDAIKLNSSNYNNPNLSIEIANRHYARNIFDENVNNLEIPLNIFTEVPVSVTDNYDLVFEGMDDLLKMNKHFQLEDRATGDFYDILGDTTFSMSMFDTVTVTRFFLQVNEPLNIISLADVSCSGAADGKIIVAGNGAGAHTYIWKDGLGNILKTTNNQLGADSLTLLVGDLYSVEIQNNGTYGTTVYDFVINEPTAIASSFSINEDNNMINWGYSNDVDTMQVEINKMISFFNESTGENTYLWDFGDLTSSSQENASKTYFTLGTYKVELTAGNGACDDVSQKYITVNSPTGIEETNLLNNFTVINIENGILVSLNNEDSKDVSFSIINSLGQEVFSKDVNAEINHQERIKLDNAQGVYLVTVRDSKNTKTKKIVLSKK